MNPNENMQELSVLAYHSAVAIDGGATVLYAADGELKSDEMELPVVVQQQQQQQDVSVLAEEPDEEEQDQHHHLISLPDIQEQGP